MNRRTGPATLLSVRVLLPLTLASVLLLAGCSKGTYPLDIFQEMHYQQSVKSQEPNRLQAPPEAVPVNGRDPVYTQADLGTLSEMQNPLPKTEANVERGGKLFARNCSMCHGPQAKGDGKVGDYLLRDGYVRPPNLTAPTTAARTDGNIYGIMTVGIFVMPSFQHLISSDDRWAIVLYLRDLQGK